MVDIEKFIWSLKASWMKRFLQSENKNLFFLKTLYENVIGLGRSFFVCCLAHRGSTVGFLLLQYSSGIVRYPRDLQVSVATRSCRVLVFASS